VSLSGSIVKKDIGKGSTEVKPREYSDALSGNILGN